MFIFAWGNPQMIPVISNHFCLKQNDLLVGFVRFLVDKSFSRHSSREVLGKEAHIFAADRKQFGRSAGPKRNNEIVEAADLVIAFPGKGRGTWNTIYRAWKKGIPVDVFPIR
jgi:hypothetical protein